MSFQAPGFYERMAIANSAALRTYPQATRIWLAKGLNLAAS
jgi:hypothetical protein